MTDNTSELQSSIEAGAKIIRNGGLVAFPTETVYGLGANALDSKACARIFEAKKRPLFDPLIVHVAEPADLKSVASRIPSGAEKLMAVFWPGPLTLVVERNERIPLLVCAGLDSVAVRCPSHSVARQLIASAGVPVAAPSANSFGHLSPTKAAHVREDIGSAVDLIIDGGDCDFGLESTIVDVRGDVPVVLRYGAVSVEAIREVVPNIRIDVASSSKPSAPGQLDSHYAPRTPLRIIEGEVPMEDGVAYVGFRSMPAGFKGKVLSSAGSLTEAAARLFEVLHDLDDGTNSVIYIERVPDEFIGKAINDRIRRAAVK